MQALHLLISNVENEFYILFEINNIDKTLPSINNGVFLEKIKQKHEEKGGFEEKYRYTQKIRILTDQMQKNLSYLMASGGFKLVLDTYNEANEALRKKMKSIQRRVLTLNIFSFIMENISEI